MPNSRVPPGEMPVVSDRYRRFDIDGSNGLSPPELQQLSAGDIADVFVHGVSEFLDDSTVSNHVTYDQAADVFLRLPPETRTYALRDILFIPSPITRFFVTGLAFRDQNILAHDLVRDNAADVDGLRGYSLLRDVPSVLRHQLMGGIALLDPEYAEKIRGWKVPLLAGQPDSSLRPTRPTHPGAAQALRDAARGRDIQVFGFGEVHVGPENDNLPVPTTLQHFANEIVPVLVRESGVSLIAVEHFPADIGDEIEYYLGNGRTHRLGTARLNFILSHGPDSRGLLALLDCVRNLRRQGYAIELRGTGPSFSSEIEVLPFNRAVPIINENCLRIVAEARASGRKVALYNGALHNDVVPPDHQDAPISYVPRLGLSQGMFLEMDLLVPEYYMGAFGLRGIESLHPPLRGVSLRGTGNRRCIIFAPASPFVR